MKNTAVAENNKRIAKNTVYLYIRSLFTLFVGLFTSRVVLNTLGVDDYGLNNVVAGFVSMLGYFNVVLSQGTSRFLTISLGRGDMNELKNTFSACLAIQAILAIAIFIIGETFGLWFLNAKMNILPERLHAANIVYQFALLGSFLTINQVPYSASVVSHERMHIYAYMSIFDVVMKLLIVYLLLYVNADKLILYSVFYFCVNVLNIIIYRAYCVLNFQECRFRFKFDTKLYRDMFNYVGWNSIGTFAFMINGQGINVLLNLFFGTVVNAARGIAFTVSNVIDQFVANFQTAVNPQVIKYYALGEYAKMNQLVSNNSKYSAFLVLLFGLPVLFETDFLIHLWLGHVPDYVVPFIRLTLFQMLMRALDSPIGRGIHAYGRMKLPNLTSSIVYLMVLPVTYVSLRLGASPEIAYIVTVSVYPIAWGFDLWILHKYTGFNVANYFKEAVSRVVIIGLLSVLFPAAIVMSMPSGWLRFVALASGTVSITAISILYIGMDSDTREEILRKILAKVRKDG